MKYLCSNKANLHALTKKTFQNLFLNEKNMWLGNEISAMHKCTHECVHTWEWPGGHSGPQGGSVGGEKTVTLHPTFVFQR